MNQGSNTPSGGQPGGKGRRRRRGRRGPVTHGSPAQPGQHPGQQRHGPPKRHGRKPGGWQAGQNQPGGGIYTAPMDHSYRAAPARIFAFVDDLFFMAKIQETARKMNVKVEFVKTEKDLNERMGENGNDKPALIIFDLNNVSAKPLSIIPNLKLKLKKATNII